MYYRTGYRIRLEVEALEVSLKETEKTVKTLKNGKPPDREGIISDLIKCGIAN